MAKKQQEIELSPDEALARLIKGNARFAAQETALAEGRQPIATILACNDLQAPVEAIFDQRPESLLVLRVDGNGYSSEVAESLQYGSSHLQTPLIVVLGHENCAAVDAALVAKKDEAEQGAPAVLTETISFVLPKFASHVSRKERLTRAVESNVRWTVQQILTTSDARITEGRLKIVGAIYDFESGRVRFLS